MLDKEIGYERETGRYKIGDGIHNWNDLSYSNSIKNIKDGEAEGSTIEGIGGITNINNAHIEGYGSGGIVKAFQPLLAELVVCPYDAETDSFSVGDVITAEYDTSNPTLRAKATFIFQGNTYEIDNVGDFNEIREKLGLANTDDIGLRFTFNSVEGIEVGMTYNFCYPKDTKFRYGKVIIVEENSIIVDNETTGIHRYLTVFNGLPKNDTSFYGNVVINGGLIGEIDISESEGVSLHSEGIETYATIGANSNGFKTKALSFGASSGGRETIVSGDTAFGHGALLDIAAHNSFGGGELIRILPDAYGATGFGSNITLKAPYEFGAGSKIDISGKYGFGIGANHEVIGDYAGALNQSNKATGTASLATGAATEAKEDYTFTSGYHTIANRPCQAVFGRYNEEDTEGKYLFILGNGASDNRTNIFTVDNHGSAIFKGNVDAFAGNFRSNITSAGSINAAGIVAGAEANFKRIYSTGDIYANGDKKVALDSDIPKKIKDGEGARSAKFGSATKAPGNDSFAGGNNSEANAMRTFAVGQWTIADSPVQAAFGKFNTRDTDEKYAFILGNGRSDSLRSDAVKVDWQGNTYLAGNVYVGDSNVPKVGGYVQKYDPTIPNIKVANSPFITEGKIIEVNGEYRTITGISVYGVTATLTLNSAFSNVPTISDVYLIYNNVTERNNDNSKILATREYVDSKEVELVQANWNQYNSTADDYIKNRPFYEDRIHIDAHDVNPAGLLSHKIAKIEAGKTYEIVFLDTNGKIGATYYSIAALNGDNIPCINIDNVIRITKEFLYNESIKTYWQFFGESLNYDRVKLYEYALKKIDNKFLDLELDGYAKTEDVNTQIDTKIAEMVDSAPETLNTLNELAKALGDDPNFATTVANMLAKKIDIDAGIENEGKFLQVVNGKATWTSIANAKEVTF